MEHYCTFFDRNYAGRGLALYGSLLRHGAPFSLWVLCMDDPTHQLFEQLRLAHVRPIRLPDFEAANPEVAATRGTRSLVEYYFTCTPALPFYVLRQCQDVDRVTYVDSDLYFYGSPRPIFDEMGGTSTLIVGHRFPERLRHLEITGVYNVGLLSFRRTEAGLTTLRWWRDRCVEWCYSRVDEGRYADQKYLDDWPERFEGVRVLEHEGAGLAPWNVSRYELSWHDGRVWVDGKPLIFFHFHRLKKLAPRMYDTGLRDFGNTMTSVLRDHIYAPYVRELERTEAGMPPVAQPSSARHARYGANRLSEALRLLLRGRLLVVAPRGALGG